jgi:hypothetical protein
MTKRIDLAGKRFGRLVAIEDAGRNERGVRVWRCICDCGKPVLVTSNHLNSGNTRSCGCFHSDDAARRHRTHGRCRTPEYHSWSGMIGRCYNLRNSAYDRYGGRGIRVCAWWKSFEHFYEDMGPRPHPGRSIDRIDNNFHYSCGHCPECLSHGWRMNCRWATSVEQSRNKRSNLRFTIGGTTQCLTEWCIAMGMPFPIARRKLQKGLSIEQVLGIHEVTE